LGLLIVVVVLAASVQDRDGANTALLHMYLAAPIRFVYADGGFGGKLLHWATSILRTSLHIVRKPEGQQGFAVIPRRWAVQQTLAWLTAHRRLARDYERDPATADAMIRRAATNAVARRIVRGLANRLRVKHAGGGLTANQSLLQTSLQDLWWLPKTAVQPANPR
jgi:transposase